MDEEIDSKKKSLYLYILGHDKPEEMLGELHGKDRIGCGGLSKNAPRRLGCLNTRFPVGGAA